MPDKQTINGIIKFASRLEGIDVKILQEGLEISHMHRQIERLFAHDYWTRWGLSAVQIRIMMILFHNADRTLTPAKLSEEVMLTRSAMTSVLDSLEKRGHTAREPHPHDRRKIVICLTPSGRRFFGQRSPELLRRIQILMSHLTRQERLSLLKAYRKILDLLNGGEVKQRA